MAGGPLPSIPPRKTPPPDGFVAAAFVDIAALESTADIEVINLGAYGQYFENYYLPEQNVVWFMLFGAETRYVYLFVSRDGTVLGQIATDERLASMGSVMLGLDGYYEIGSETLSGPLPYELLDEPLDHAALKALQSQSTYYRRISASDVASDRPEYAMKRDTHFFLQDGVWKKATSSNSPYLEWKYPPFVDLTVQYDLAPHKAPSFFEGAYRVSRTYFDQQEFFGKKPAPMGSTTGVGRAAHWRGTGYYTVEAKGAEMRFFIPNDRLNTGGSGPILLTIEGHEMLDFIFLKHQYRGQDYHAYLLTARQL
ncbi:MAG: hypothetical protein AAGA08_19105 [Pseudomonadota bacterium]